MEIKDIWQQLEVDHALADGVQRKEAINPFSSYIVQAPAGSGKTALLTQRFLALLCTVQAPEQVVAMTFTKKAAAEMRNRILEALQSGQQPLPSSDSLYDRNTHRLAQAALAHSNQQGWHLLENPSRLRIRTLDSMNGYLVQQMPYLSRFGAQSQVSEQVDTLYRQAAVQALQDEAAQEASSALLRLVNGRFSQAVELIVAMLYKRDQWLGLVFNGQNRHDLEAALAVIVQQEMQAALQTLQPAKPILAQIVALADDAIAHEPKQPLEKVVGFDLTETLDSLPHWQALANWVLTAQGTIRKSITKAQGFPAGKGEAKEKKAQMSALLNDLREITGAEEALAKLRDLPQPHYEDAQWQDLQHLMILMKQAAAHLKLLFIQSGESDFIEVALAANQALGSEEAPTDLALQLDYRIQHLLIDEFQDTSVTQSELLKKLVAGWQPDDGRTLFIVGDPMQSIYRFREAEVGNFLQAWGSENHQAALGEVALTPLQLQVNFRSTQGVIQWVNQTFKRLFPKQNDMAKGAVSYSPAEAAVAEKERDAVSVMTHWAINQTDVEHYQQMVDVIQQRLSALPEKEKIAVLGRSRSHLVAVAVQLKQAGIAFRAVELEQLNQRQEVQDIQALTRALLHLGDRDAWLALLRSPLVGLNLPDLTVLAGLTPGEQKKWSLWQILQALNALWQAEAQHPDKNLEKSQNSQSCLRDLAEKQLYQLSEEGVFRLKKAVPVLQAALNQWHSEHPVALVKATWLALLGAQTVPDATALENIEAYLQMLGQIPASELRFDTIEQQLEHLYALPDTQEAASKIELMTMHKSKGLEFDTVLLPSLGKKGRHNEEQVLNWLQFRQGEQAYWVLAPLTQKNSQDRPALLNLIKQYDQEKQKYENLRLLYVAATRAKKQLHLFATVAYTEKQMADEASLKPQAGSLLELMWPEVKQEFAPLLAEVDFECDQPGEPLKPRVPRLPLSALSQVGFLKPIHRPTKPSVQTASELAKSDTESTFYLANETGRLVGVLLHQQLEQWVRQGFTPEQKKVFVKTLPKQKPLYQTWLQQQGLTVTEAEMGCQRLLQGLENALAHEKLCWALDSRHPASAVELALHEVLPDQTVVQHIVDRTFIDDQGVRWIVDYKTSRFAGNETELDAWLEEKVAHYRPQLARYGALFAQQEDNVQRWVLYFSDVNQWVEVSPTAV